MKSDQFFKIYKRFDNKRKRTHTAVNEKRKTEKKSTLYFITGLFYKAPKPTCSPFLLFVIRMTQKISKGEIGKGK